MSNTDKTPSVPVTIVTGFLGAGKTSLLNHILKGDHGRRIAVMVNDFGAVNIDADLIENRDGEVVSLENGCICCSLSDGLLAAAIGLIRREQPPEHIVIETSGVSDPIEIARTFSEPELQPYAPLDGIVTVVDAENAPDLEDDMARLAHWQVAAADLVLINKIDLVDEESRQRARDWVNGHSPTARVLEVSHGAAAIDLVLGIGADPSDRCLDSAHHHDDHSFDSFTYEHTDPIPMQRLNTVLSQLPKTVFRAKGILNLSEKPDHPCILQSTGKRATLTVGEPWGDRTPNSRIVFIGTRGGVDATALQRALSSEAREPVKNPTT